MKNCISESSSIVVSHQDTYIGLMLLYNEHQKTAGNIIRFTRKRFSKALSHYIGEPLCFQEIIDILLFDKHIQENKPTKLTPEITYTVTLKGATEFQMYKESKEYKQYFLEVKEMLGKEVSECELFEFDSSELRGLQNKLTHVFYVHFLENLREEEMLREIGWLK